MRKLAFKKDEEARVLKGREESRLRKLRRLKKPASEKAEKDEEARVLIGREKSRSRKPIRLRKLASKKAVKDRNQEGREASRPKMTKKLAS